MPGRYLAALGFGGKYQVPTRWRGLRPSRWFTLRLWRQRLVFWGGAIAVGCVSVAFADAAHGHAG
jgi:hypothetical protein